MKINRLAGIVWVLTLACVALSGKSIVRPSSTPGPGGAVNLPFLANDSKGQVWRIYQGGYVQNQGPTPNGGNTATYSQGAQLMINGANPQMTNNQGRVDDKSGELVLENMRSNGFTVTRRIFVNKEEGYVRYIDVLKNTQGQDQTAQVVVSTNLNYGINASQNVNDPKKPAQAIGWVAQTGSMACVFEMFAGKNSKLTPQISGQQGNSQVQATFSVNVPAGKEVALMHMHGMSITQDAGQKFMIDLKEAQLLKNIPREIRRILANFVSGQSFVGDLEVLRGDLLDVVELRTGDQLKGTLKETTFELATGYGPVTLPVDKVVGVINSGQFRPRQLVVTSDGQVFGGALKKDALDLQLSSGQVTQIPLAQVARVGYRKRAGEPEEWTFDKPMVLMRSGERVSVKPTPTPLEVATRYGKVSLKPQQVAAVLLQTEETAVHQLILSDGSHFAGLLTADRLDLTLETTDQPASFQLSSVSRLQFSPQPADIEDDAATLRLANDDLLVGTIGGQVKVDTAFDTITVNASEIKSLVRAKESSTDAQLMLWDGSTVSGQLRETELPVELACGLSLKVGLAVLDEYSQPQPQPSKDMVEKIKKLIDDLNSEDWRTRDRAQASLTGMGPVAIRALKQMRADQPAEAQSRFDSILKELEGQKKATKAAKGGPAATPQPVLNKDE